MNIAYFAPGTIHDAKWLNEISKDHNVILFCDNILSNVELSIFNDSIICYPILSTYSSLSLKNNNTISKAQKLLSKHKVELIHALYAMPYALWLNHFKPYKKVITTRGSDVLKDLPLLNKSTNLKQRLINYLLKLSLKNTFENANYITSTSLNQQSAIKRLGINSHKLQLIRTGIEINNNAFLENEAIGNKEFIIFSPRSFLPIYNIDLIIDAFILFHKKHKNTRLYLINDQRKGEFYKTIAAKGKEIENAIFFLNKLNHHELIKMYKRSSLVVMLPETDGTPNTALESMLSNTPVLLGCNNYDDDLFNKTTCFSIKNKSISNIVKAFESIYNMKENELAIILKNAKKVVTEKCSLKMSIGKLNALYKKA